MFTRWISSVPPGMRRFRAMRKIFSIPDSFIRPYAPCSCTARSATRYKASSQKTFSADTVLMRYGSTLSVHRLPWSACQRLWSDRLRMACTSRYASTAIHCNA